MQQFIQIFLSSFKIKPVGSTIILLLMAFQMLLQSSNVISLVPLIDIMVNPDRPNAVTAKIIEILNILHIDSSLPVFILLVGLTTLMKFCGAYFIHVMTFKYQRDMDQHLSTTLYSDLFSSDWSYFASHQIGSLTDIMGHKCHTAASAFMYSFQACHHLFSLAAFSMVPLIISVRITLGCAAIGCLMLVPLWFVGRFYYRISRRIEALLNEHMQYLIESIGAAKAIFAYAATRSTIRKYRDIIHQRRRKLLELDMVSGVVSLTNEPISICSALIIIYLFLHQTSEGLSALAVIVYSLTKMMSSAHQSVNTYNMFQSVRPAVDIVMNESRKAIAARETSGNIEFKGLQDGITFLNTKFHYTPGKDVLKGIDLKIKKGSMTAFVGGSGEGKTTLIDLIVGLYRPSSGQILIDGVDLWELDLVSWRQKLGYIPQDSVLFNTTIRENIVWGTNRTVSDEALYEVARKAYAHDFILACKDGYDTVVGDRGLRLSGGQRQRIALARAILREPELLILDEATSSLDSESEAMIQKSIEDFSREITVIVVAHRLSTLRHADEIFILDQGGIVGSGRFDELVHSNSIFQKYSALQELRS